MCSVDTTEMRASCALLPESLIVVARNNATDTRLARRISDAGTRCRDSTALCRLAGDIVSVLSKHGRGRPLPPKTEMTEQADDIKQLLELDGHICCVGMCRSPSPAAWPSYTRAGPSNQRLSYKSGRNTDEYQKRDGKWCCSGVNVIAENTGFDDGAGVIARQSGSS